MGEQARGGNGVEREGDWHNMFGAGLWYIGHVMVVVVRRRRGER
jgi:hypothetical protein